jgi:hypothetical protein
MDPPDPEWRLRVPQPGSIQGPATIVSQQQQEVEAGTSRQVEGSSQHLQNPVIRDQIRNSAPAGQAPVVYVSSVHGQPLLSNPTQCMGSCCSPNPQIHGGIYRQQPTYSGHSTSSAQYTAQTASHLPIQASQHGQIFTTGT